jgi:hypothetical protein
MGRKYDDEHDEQWHWFSADDGDKDDDEIEGETAGGDGVIQR